MTKDVVIGVRVTPEVRDRLRELASKEDRTVSNFAARILGECAYQEEREQERRARQAHALRMAFPVHLKAEEQDV